MKKKDAASIKYTTAGVGLAYRWDNNIKLMGWCDTVTNETSSNLDGEKSDMNDNIMTLRAQIII